MKLKWKEKTTGEKILIAAQTVIGAAAFGLCIAQLAGKQGETGDATETLFCAMAFLMAAEEWLAGRKRFAVASMCAAVLLLASVILGLLI